MKSSKVRMYIPALRLLQTAYFGCSH